MKKLRVFVVMMAVVAGLMAGPVFAQQTGTGTVSATVTPGLVSITVSPDSIGYGIVPLSEIAEPNFQNCNDDNPTPAFVVTNSGNLDAEFRIKGAASFEFQTGTITNIVTIDNDDTVTVTSADHGLTVSDDSGKTLIIDGTSNFDGTSISLSGMTVVDTNSFTYEDSSKSSVVSDEDGLFTWAIVGDPSTTGWVLGTSSEALNEDNTYAHLFTSSGGTDSVRDCDFDGDSAGDETGSISGVSVTDPVGGATIASVGHGLDDGDKITINTELDQYDGETTITVVDVDSFEIPIGFTSSSTGDWTHSAAFTAIDTGASVGTVNATGHGLRNGDFVKIAVASGDGSYNGTFQISGVTIDTFEITTDATGGTGAGVWTVQLVGTDGELSGSNRLLDNFVSPGDDADVFLQLGMPTTNTRGENDQSMSVLIQVSVAD